MVGLAYHAGALAGLAHDLGWDPRSADVVVGTSAGSVAGTLLRAGAPAHDLAAAIVGAEVLDADDLLTEPVPGKVQLPALRLRELLRRPNLPSPGLVASWAVRPWRFDPVGLLTSLLPHGRIDLRGSGGDLGALIAAQWPMDPLWLTAIRRRDLRLVVFGRDDTAVPLGDAVAASCAIPGFLAPVVVDGEQHIDGGVRSPTNADVLVPWHDRVDLVVVLAPMSGRGLAGAGVETMVRRHGRRRLDAEERALRAVGLPTVRIEPGPRARAEMGMDLMGTARLTEVVRAAFLETGEQIGHPKHRALLAGLRHRALARR
jgi:NTE family protein